MTLTPVAERLAVELSLPDFTTYVCRDRGSNPGLPHAKRTPLCHRGGQDILVEINQKHRRFGIQYLFLFTCRKFRNYNYIFQIKITYLAADRETEF